MESAKEAGDLACRGMGSEGPASPSLGQEVPHSGHASLGTRGAWTTILPCEVKIHGLGFWIGLNADLCPNWTRDLDRGEWT